ncbi:uncharacterized protein CELE_F02H6.7 [Caenorhabditis elegans]|uniref:Uncharacterized protein n=1 Tax=Caenorhabditis elegans TaxID=6239 RepID=O62135_CAEEL|nr:Uncharacterized protein CELE_F02H6.7 [Caenorhabditis elegans]CAB05175.2 Uncharacterized protein CELE_F02H6.7 [Caenorhabditis elegans]|eukprot:NP_502730.2 Uncharacterized protein CELE_F02H6.7 [Caenorhabditis elegans]
MLKLHVFFLVLLQISNAADCPICPTGGIWSEWTSNGVCATTCGACSNLNYTRTCLSDGLKNCPCVGSTRISQPCGTQACNYPRTNGPGAPCCIGTPKVINNWYHCGSNSQNAAPTQPCCPVGGVWTEWTRWAHNGANVEWSRSRDCISGGYNCACIGENQETKFECPCTPMKPIPPTNTDCSSLTNRIPYLKTPAFDKGNCIATVYLEASNFRESFYSYNYKLEKDSAVAGWIDKAGNCEIADFPTGFQDGHGAYTPFSFHCNVTSGAWYYNWEYYGINMKEIDMFALLHIPRSS